MFRCSHKFNQTQLRKFIVNRYFSLNACIVGTGPSAFYTAKYLLKKVPEAEVTFIDQFPIPFGLVRYGVAPDHASTKNCVNDFNAVLEEDRVKFYGNVELGVDVSLKELRKHFSCVVLAYGSSSDKDFGIPGEHGNNILSARRFVNWYNGHPLYSNLEVNLNGTSAVILGQGNVAIDCARILAQPIERLQTTDICQHAIEKIKATDINQIHMVGRRGPVQIASTNKELREVVSGIEGLQGVVHEEDFAHGESCQAEIDTIRGLKRKVDIFSKASKSVDLETKNIIFDFFLQPVEFKLDEQNNVKAVVFEKCQLSGEPGKQKSSGTGEFTEIETQFVLKSIGYKGVQVDEDIPWNERAGTIPAKNGKIEDGLYCAGWIKRGPSGVIATNIPDAQETVKHIIKDWNNSLLQDTENTWVPNKEFVDKEGWFKLDRYEIEEGAKIGKPREKLVDVQKMLGIAL